MLKTANGFTVNAFGEQKRIQVELYRVQSEKTTRNMGVWFATWGSLLEGDRRKNESGR